MYARSSEKNDGAIKGDRIISVATMKFNPEQRFSGEDYLQTYNIMRLGDIAFEGHPSKDFMYGRFVENTIGPGIISHIFDVFSPKGEYDLLYWKYAINLEKLMRPVLVKATKASTMMHNLVASDFLEEEIPVPAVAEQQAIGAFFAKLDSLITLHQRE